MEARREQHGAGEDDERGVAEYLVRQYAAGDAAADALLQGDPDLGRVLEYLEGRADASDARLGSGSGDEPAAEDVKVSLSVPGTCEPSLALGLLKRLAEHGPREERYEVGEELGRGGMGIVHRAWDPHLRRFLALKVCGVRLGSSWRDELDRRHLQKLGHFFQEAQITAQLDHPGIVPVQEIGLRGSGDLYFTMRLVRGRTLSEVLDMVRRGPVAKDAAAESWSVVRAAGVLQRACEAMAYAHSKGVLHRDLKPTNVMVGDFGEVYVVDWGLAKLVEEAGAAAGGEVASNLKDEVDGVPDSPVRTAEGAVLGTLAYMPPEQAAGEHWRVGPQSDVYSMGSILYEMLTGRAPFSESEGRAATLAALLTSRPRPVRETNPNVSRELAAICERAMARLPEERYASMADLANDLRAYLEGHVVLAYERGPWAEAKKWVRRNRALSTAMLVAAVLGGLGLFWWGSARSNLESYRRRDDVQRLDAVVARARSLWPPAPAQIDGLQACSSDLEQLLSRLDVHQGTLKKMRERSGRSVEAGWEFDDEVLGWQHAALAELVDRLELAAAPNGLFLSGSELAVFASDAADAPRDEEAAAPNPYFGLRDSLQRRLAHATALRDGPAEHDASWQEAIPAIARSPMYDGLVLARQAGLVPLGPDPASDLWEFAVLGTGASPPKRGADGELVLDAQSMLVLVLLPGGEVWIGTDALPDDMPEELRELLPRPDEDEGNGPNPIELDPFFLSKYELTQGQWRWLTGTEPSVRANELTSLFPVENVSWEQSKKLLECFGLRLPTEAQWEYAARAGSDDLWCCGNDPRCLIGKANLLDVTAQRLGERGDVTLVPAGMDDPFFGHCDVRALEANPLGLHHMNGNVWEWCMDYYGPYEEEVTPGDGERISQDSSNRRVRRGGSFLFTALEARSAYRNNGAPTGIDRDTGVRPARRLDP